MVLSEGHSPKSSIGGYGKALQRWCLNHYRAIWGEFVATAMLLFFGSLGCLSEHYSQTGLIATWGFGFVILFLVHVFAKITGAHFNPAVTLLALILGNISIPLAIAYAAAQCLGATLGSYLVLLVSPPTVSRSIFVTAPMVEFGIGRSIAIEAVLTWILALLCCIVWDPNIPNQRWPAAKFGLAIGGLAMIGGPLTGGSMNPARSLGPAIVTGIWSLHYIYWIGPFIGSILAAATYTLHAKLNHNHPKISQISDINNQA